MLLYLTIWVFTLIAEHGRCYEDPERGQLSLVERREALVRGPRRRAASIFLLGLAAFLVAITCGLIAMGMRQSLKSNRQLDTIDLVLFCVPAMLAVGVLASLCLEWLFMRNGVLDRIMPIKRGSAYNRGVSSGLPPATHLSAGPILMFGEDSFDRGGN